MKIKIFKNMQNQQTIDEVNYFLENSDVAHPTECKGLCSIDNTDEENLKIIIRTDFTERDKILPSEVDRILKDEWLGCKWRNFDREQAFKEVGRAFKINQTHIDKYVELFKDCKEVYYGVSALYSTINEYLMGDKNLASQAFKNDEYFHKDGRFKSWCFDEFIIGYLIIGDIVYVNAGNDCGCDDALYIVGLKN